MTVKSLYPTVLPSLNLDFANSKKLDPRVTFTRASVGTFVNENGLIATAASGAARFDHDPVTGKCLGLLVEEARTNLAYGLLSTYDNGGAFTQIVPNYATGPDGVFNASRYVWSSASSAFIRSSFNSLSSNGYYTSSIFIKPLDNASSSFLQVGSIDSAKVGRVFFDHNTKTITSTISTNAIIQNVSSTLTSFPDGWYRLTVSVYVSDYTQLGFGNALALVYAAYTDNGDVLLSLPQLEAGAFPTSYIPTVASTVTRAADVASITGTNFSSWYRQDEGTVFASAVSARITGAAVGFGNVSPFEEIASYGFVNTTIFSVYTSGAYQANINTGSIAAGQQYKQAGAYKVNDFAASRNGASVVKDTSGLVPTSISYMTIGNTPGGNPTFWGLNGTIARIAYYPARLPDAQLQALTAT